MSKAEGGQGKAELGQGNAALAALRAGDLDAFSDWLHTTNFATTTDAGETLHSIAHTIVAEGLDAGFAPTATVDEITAILAGRCGIAISPTALAGPDGSQSRRALIESGRLDDAAIRRELLAAHDEIVRLRAKRDALEAKVDELSGARVLADQLAAELERDEWIRARLRRLKSTRPVRGLIYVRRRVQSRTKSATSR
ncbi:MAG: hypothetical protein ABI658_20500 [Acidimicrobiales bacterium]